MRALLDANIFISFLLPSGAANTIGEIIEAALQGEFTLLIVPELLEEFSRRVRTKEYLAARIRGETLQEFVDTLIEYGEEIGEITSIPPISRDRKDDYLLSYAVVGEADYLVSGDRDLTDLGEVEGVRIVTPAEFLAILRQGRVQDSRD